MSGVSSGIIGGVLAVILIGILTPLVKRLAFVWNSKKNKNYGLALAENQKHWLSINAKKLAQEKSSKIYPFWVYSLWGGMLPVAIGMGAVFIIIYILMDVFQVPLDAEVLAWSRIDFGVALVFSIFLGIFIAAVVMIILAKFSPTVRDYLTYQYGWGYMSPKPRGETEIKEELEHFLRKNIVSSDNHYDSDYFSNLIFYRTSPAWKKSTAIIFVLTILFFIFDVRYQVNVYQNKIITSSYFSLMEKEYKIEDVVSINRKCTLGKNNGNFYPYLSYYLVMSDTKKVNLYSLETRENFSKLQLIETLFLRLKKVKAFPTEIKSAPAVSLEPTVQNCIDFIRRNETETKSNRIIKLFDLNHAY